MLSGETYTARVAYHLGHFKRLMTDADLERKFRPMAEEGGLSDVGAALSVQR